MSGFRGGVGGSYSRGENKKVVRWKGTLGGGVIKRRWRYYEKCLSDEELWGGQRGGLWSKKSSLIKRVVLRKENVQHRGEPVTLQNTKNQNLIRERGDRLLTKGGQDTCE